MNVADIKNVAVIGAGDMGHGIAEVALMAGYTVYLRDINQEFVDRGVARIRESLTKLVSKGKVTAEQEKKINAELLKKETFAAIDAAAKPHTLMASNTSTMKITEIGSLTKRPEKVLGLHYFNPAVLMRLVEVIRGAKTSDETMQVAFDFVLKNGKVPVRVEKDVPGFIVNRVQAPSGVLLSCIINEGIAQPEEVDALLRKLGMPMGPFELMDYTGLDISYHGRQYYAQTIHPDFAPGKAIEEKVKAGELGKKTGKGFFDWSKGRPEIDLSKATDKLDPFDLIVVQINEATKLIEMGVCSAEDVDTAIVNGTGNIGPMSVAKGQKPAELTKRLEGLAKRFNKEIFKPTKMIREGRYR